MSVKPYDFRKPGRLAGEVEQRLTAWLRAACAAAPERLARHLPFAVELTHGTLDVSRPSDALAGLPEGTIGYRVRLVPDGPGTLFVFPRRLLLALVTGVLGDVKAEPPPDRALTPVESSVSECVVQHLLAALNDTWPGVEELCLEIERLELAPKRVRMFASDDNVIACTQALRGPFGEHQFWWLAPQQPLLHQFNRTGRGSADQTSVRPQLEAIAREVPVEVSVGLGEVQLDVAQLARLRAGDLIILNQRVSDPLTASVAGETKFRVWPGRVGSRQAFQVESIVEC